MYKRITLILRYQEEWMHLLSGGTNMVAELENPAPEWISSRSWQEILTVGSLPTFAKFPGSFYKHLVHYKEYFDSIEPHRLNQFLTVISTVLNIKTILYIYYIYIYKFFKNGIK